MVTTREKPVVLTQKNMMEKSKHAGTTLLPASESSWRALSEQKKKTELPRDTL